MSAVVKKKRLTLLNAGRNRLMNAYVTLLFLYVIMRKEETMDSLWDRMAQL